MSQPSTSSASTDPATNAAAPASAPTAPLNSNAEPILCQHCGRTASNGISCEGYCVADSGY